MREAYKTFLLDSCKWLFCVNIQDVGGGSGEAAVQSDTSASTGAQRGVPATEKASSEDPKTEVISGSYAIM